MSLSQIRGQIAAKHLDGRFMTPFGLMALNGEITQLQYNAGLRFAGAAEAYRAALLAPPVCVPAQDISRLGGHDSLEQSDDEVRENQRAIVEWDHISTLLTPLQLKAASYICDELRMPDSYVHRMALKYALDRLCALWGMR